MIDRKQLYDLLKGKGIYQLYHANSVATSITYLEMGGLLSRGAVRDLGLYQTSQSSDRLDMFYDVWDDIFLDMYDLHAKFGRENYYGPVLFKFSIDLLLKTKYQIRITKSNPRDWLPGERKSDRYFKNVQEVNRTWEKYEQQKRMITLRQNRRPALFNYLEEVVLDLPGPSDKEYELYSAALKKLRKASREGAPRIKLTKRLCKHCYCEENYSKYKELRLKKMFSPEGR